MSAVMVFSHPNHEIAVLGSIKRLKPYIIYLTDGGGEARVDQTKAALAAYLPSQNMTFLNHSEQALYDALIENDVDFYKALSAQLAEQFERLKPSSVYCDTAEFYNPVHDMALPVVRRALNGSAATLYEIPLVYEKTGEKEAFEMQRVPASLAAQSITVELNEDELAQKITTIKSGVYGMLFQQMGRSITGAIPSHAKLEQFLKGRTQLPRPAPEQVLRYDYRGKAQKEAGAVREAITYKQHYTPMFEALCGKTQMEKVKSLLLPLLTIPPLF